MDRDFLDSIYKLFRSEFAKFRRELLDTFKEDINRITNNIRCLSDRIDKLEKKELHTNDMFVFCEESILKEITEREKRSVNLIFFNLDKCESLTNAHVSDAVLVKNIIQTIEPNDVPNVKTAKLGANWRGHPRPV